MGLKPGIKYLNAFLRYSIMMSKQIVYDKILNSPAFIHKRTLDSRGLPIICLERNIIGGSMKTFNKVMKALSDPNRIKIIKLLQQKKMCVCEIQEALRITQPSVSKHLKILEEAGVVDYSKDGLWVDYYLANGDSSPYVATMIGNLKHWLNDDPAIAELIEKAPFLDRQVISKK